ncbi:MAG: prepilin-type N-terminal cleavage/methylation domain-containing protein [Nitrospinae bacterium]|nr:prepilin-type N-terminal cleavage/methylation domain-containing protein [Nitrospinota bacterium]
MKSSNLKAQSLKLRYFNFFNLQSSIFNSQRGFTLIELIIAITIVSMIMAIILGGMRLSIRAWEVGEERVEVYQTGRVILERMSQEIKSIYPYRYEKEISTEDKTEKTKKSVLAFKGEADRLWFVTFSEGLSQGMQSKGLREVLYYIEKDHNKERGKLLYREGIIFPHSIFDDASTFLISTGMDKETENKGDKEGSILTISEQIAGLKLRYYLVRKEKGEDGKEENVGEWAESFSGEDEIREEEEAKKIEEGGTEKKKRGKPSLKAIEIKLSIYELNPDETINREKVISFSPLIVPINAGREIKAV